MSDELSEQERQAEEQAWRNIVDEDFERGKARGHRELFEASWLAHRAYARREGEGWKQYADDVAERLHDAEAENARLREQLRSKTFGAPLVEHEELEEKLKHVEEMWDEEHTARRLAQNENARLRERLRALEQDRNEAASEEESDAA